MGTKTGIEWTDTTWNPIMGCSRVSEGCRHCYAERLAGRFEKAPAYAGLTQIVNGAAVWTGKIKETKTLLDPLRWRCPRRVFVNSMSDLFHENVSDELRDRIFAVMALTPQHAYQVLTKRPERMLAYLSPGQFQDVKIASAAKELHTMPKRFVLPDTRIFDERRVARDEPWEIISWPLPSVWLGVSAEDQKTADARIPLLLQTPAAVRFVSCEPLLGPVDIRQWTGTECRHDDSWCESDMNATMCSVCESTPTIDWVICGGESGPGARSAKLPWVRSLRDQCQAAGVPFFFKQWGHWVPTEDAAIAKARGLEPEMCMSYRPHKKDAGAMLDGREWKEWPTCR